MHDGRKHRTPGIWDLIQNPLSQTTSVILVLLTPGNEIFCLGDFQVSFSQ